MTNELVTIDFKELSLKINKDNMFGNLNDLWTVGNALRISKNRNQLDLHKYLKSEETKLFIEALHDHIGYSPIKVKEGRYGGTWVHLYILLDAAGKLDASFKVQIYKRVIDGGLLKWRDDSGDSYKALNIAIDGMLSKLTGEKTDIAVYINIANQIREKVNPTGGQWNTATHEELSYRTRIENNLISFIKAGLVNGYGHLVSIINNIE